MPLEHSSSPVGAVARRRWYEVDDWLHAIKHLPDHAFCDGLQHRDLAEYERCANPRSEQ